MSGAASRVCMNAELPQPQCCDAVHTRCTVSGVGNDERGSRSISVTISISSAILQGMGLPAWWWWQSVLASSTSHNSFPHGAAPELGAASLPRIHRSRHGHQTCLLWLSNAHAEHVRGEGSHHRVFRRRCRHLVVQCGDAAAATTASGCAWPWPCNSCCY